MPSQISSLDEGQIKQLRLRKIYIQLRLPRVKSEISALATRKKELGGSAGEASKEVVQELIYSNQHLVALRKEYESLEQERKSVLAGLREIKSQETAKPRPGLAAA